MRVTRRNLGCVIETAVWSTVLLVIALVWFVALRR